MTTKKRGRPRLSVKPTIINIKLRLYPGEDDDLLAFLSSIPDRCKVSAVKAAMRSGGLMGVSADDLLDDDDLDGLLF